jgi:general secretion pathway protein A
MQQVIRLANFDPLPQTRLSVILAGRNEGMAKLDPKLLELAELRIEVDPWEPGDTEHYVAASLAQAGRQSPVFDEPAVARLHELSHGIPRRVSQLADLSLLAGAGANLQHIDVGIVDSVCQELAM